MLDEDILGQRHTSIPWRAIALLLVTALLVGTGVVLFRARTQHAATPTFSTVPVSRGDLSVGVNATGPVSTAASIPLTFKNSGLLTRVLVKPGDVVKAGQVLAQEGTTDLQHALDQARAQLAQQQAAMQKLQAGPTPQQLAVAQAAVDAAKQALAAAQQNVQTVQGQGAADLGAAQTAIQNAQAAASDATRTLTAVQTANAKQAQSDATAVAAATTALQTAQQKLAASQAQVQANTAPDRTAVANAQQTAANAQKALANAQQEAQAAAAVAQQQVAQAKNALYTQQVSRDAACGQSTSSPACQAGNAAVNTAQTAIDQANAAARQSAAQAQQSIAAAQSQLDQANGAVKAAQDALQAHQAAAQSSIIDAQGQVAQATSALKAAQDAQAAGAARAQQTLVQQQQAVDQAESGIKTAEGSYVQVVARNAAALHAAQATIGQAQQQVETAQANAQQVAAPPTKPELDAAQAQVDQARAAVATAQGNLDDATLRSPIDATVAQVNDIAGQFVSGGAVGTSASASSNTSSSAFIVLTNLAALQVVAQVNEADMARITLGDAVQFTLNAFPGQTFTGKVAEIQPLGSSSSNNVVSYNVTCSIDPTSTKLLPGMTANVTIATDSRQNVVLAPAAALSFAQSPAASTFAPPVSGQGSGNATLLLLQDGKPVRRPVQTGVSDGARTEIVSGPQPGEQVITGTIGGGR